MIQPAEWPKNVFEDLRRHHYGPDKRYPKWIIIGHGPDKTTQDFEPGRLDSLGSRGVRGIQWTGEPGGMCSVLALEKLVCFYLKSLTSRESTISGNPNIQSRRRTNHLHWHTPRNSSPCLTTLSCWL